MVHTCSFSYSAWLRWHHARVLLSHSLCGVLLLFHPSLLVDKCWYLNHYYLICLLAFLGIFLPANRELSIDARRYPELRSRTVPRWTLWLIRFQLGVPYFYGGLAKINWDWIHGEPMRPWLLEQHAKHPATHWLGEKGLLGRNFAEEWCVNSFVWGGMLLDLLVIPCLLCKWTRIPAMIAMTLFHFLNTSLFDIGVFPWLMLIATLVVSRRWTRSPNFERPKSFQSANLYRQLSRRRLGYRYWQSTCAGKS